MNHIKEIGGQVRSQNYDSERANELVQTKQQPALALFYPSGGFGERLAHIHERESTPHNATSTINSESRQAFDLSDRC
jgi:hypothetical protein